MNSNPDQSNAHLTVPELARFVDGRLTPSARATIEKHLATCTSCRREAIQVARLVRRRTRRKRLVIAVPAAAAAVLATLLFTTETGEPPASPGRAFRNTDDLAQQLEVVAPLDDAVIASDSVRFIWRSAGANVQYTLSVTDTSGSPVLSQSTSDTMLTLAVMPSLPDGHMYFWFVDVLFSDGESGATGIHRFTVPP